jgi:shikimate kinase
MRIYMVGYMASGKSKLGRILANKLGFGFIDLDYLFEERFRISVLDFFEKYDEQVFRNIERTLLLETSVLEDVVISTGGGTPCFFDNMNIILNSGISVYLYWDSPVLVSRLKLVKRKRPLLNDLTQAELEQKVNDHLMQRGQFYNQADLVIDGMSFDVEKVLEMIRNLRPEATDHFA